MNNHISTYIQHFSNLHSNKLKGKTAPHKAVMLISIIEMIASGLIKSNKIVFSEELEIHFKNTWKTLVREDSIFKPIAGTPFWHLNYEPFWKLVPFSGGEDTINELKKHNPYSSSIIRKNIRHAEIDIELFELLQEPSNRKIMIDILVKSI